MIKLETTYEFTLKRFNELKDIKRKNPNKNENGWLYLGDTFSCDEELANYLTGENSNGLVVAKVIEVIPEVKEEIKEEPKKDEPIIEEKPKRTIKKKSKRNKMDF